jgi:hypothetical protein
MKVRKDNIIEEQPINDGGNSITIDHSSEIQSGTGSALNDVIWTADVSDYATMGFQFTGTWNATMTLYGSNDNTNWVANAAQSTFNNNITASSTMNSKIYLYFAEVIFKYYKVEITSYSSGTVELAVSLTTAPTDLQRMGITTVSGPVQTYSYAINWNDYSGSALDAVCSPAINWYQYASAGMHVRGTFSATLSFEQSNDNSTWEPILAKDENGLPVTSTTTTGYFTFNIHSLYIRARISAYTSGTVTVETVTNNAVSEAPNYNKANLDTLVAGQLADGHNVTVDNASIPVTNANLDSPLSDIDTTLDSILAGQLADGHDVNTGGLLGGVVYDYAALTETATTDTWTFRFGGSPADTGTIVAVVLITYTDSGKGTIDDVERTTG